MIDSAILSIVEELNNSLNLKFRLNEDRIIASNLLNLDGSLSIKDENRIVVSLVNIEEEKTATPNGFGVPLSGNNHPIYLNMYVLFYSLFNEKLYNESLKFISAIIGFFQNKKVFTPNNTAGLDQNIDKVLVEINNISFHEQSNILSALGAKYSPCILYKMRMVGIEENIVNYSAPRISESGLEREREKKKLIDKLKNLRD
tara:strand:+ start:2159 stop:2761 length:603 start_codon:yes stop_codon:yes gene_type:complete